METPSEASKPADAKSVKPRPVAPTGRDALGTASSIKKRADGAAPVEVGVSRSSSMKATSSLNAGSVPRSSSTGTTVGKLQDNGSSAVAKKASPTLSDGAKKTKPVSAPAVCSKPAVEKKTSLTERKGADSVRKPAVKASTSSTLNKVQSKTESSNGSSGSTRRVASNASVPSPRSITSNSTKKLGTQTSSAVSDQRKSSTADSRDSRFMMLPQVDLKASDEVRLDSRAHRVRSLKQLRLSHALEFGYLRDNLLSSLEGTEILRGVKVLDLSFNDFKLPGFEPLGNCIVLQQLYLAGNQITSLASLPELPNLEFLSIAQNRLKSLCMGPQPRLQVLAASRNKISTLKGFPHLPSLEVWYSRSKLPAAYQQRNAVWDRNMDFWTVQRREENNSHKENIATLKKFNDRDLNPNEAEVAKQYPAHTAICIRDGWEFCSPELAADSTFSFLLEQWNNKLPQDYMVNKAYVDHPFEEDPCHCHFGFTNLGEEGELVLRYQWFLGGKTPTDFVAIPEASSEVYWPKREDAGSVSRWILALGRCLKVECTPILNGAEFPPIFAVSVPISPGTGCPKVINLAVSGELVEGNILSGVPEIAWCGGTPGKGVASWLRRRWNGNAVVIDGAEGMEYQLTVNDINSSLVFMYTPVTDEGVKGEPQCTMTDFVKAAKPSVSNVHVLGDIVEDNIVIGKGKYFGGREGLSKIRWFREKENGEFLLVLSDSMQYTLTKDDVGRHLKFVYTPVNLEGQEGESACAITDVAKKAHPKVFNLKIVGEAREGSKMSASATVKGVTEGSSRVQWFKASSSEFKNEHELEALTASKVSKTFHIPLGAVGYYVVAKFTPVAPDGEVGEPAYATSDSLVETLPPSLNFLTVTGEFSEGQILTASYGCIGGHEGNSLYSWHLHETGDDEGTPLSEATGLLQYCVTKEAVGKFVSFKCTPVRDDGIVGEARSFIGKDRVTPALGSTAMLDELIEEFLLRLPPAVPKILVHAALVCKPWYCIISDPGFRRRFREFHRAAPMLGFFCNLLDAQFIPTSCFRPPHRDNFRALDARHGRGVLHPWEQDVDEPFVVVWDPTTDERWEVPEPPLGFWGLQEGGYGTVLCAAASNAACDHHDCHGKPFTVVVVGTGIDPEHRSFFHVYSSEAATWSEPIPIPTLYVDAGPALVGSTLYFSIGSGSRSLSYDLGTRETSVIHLPPMPGECATALMVTENGGLGVARLDEAAKLSLWSMEVNPNAEIGWTQIKVIELDKALPVEARSICSVFLRFAQGAGVFFVGTCDGLFSFDLSSGRARKVFEEPCDEFGLLGCSPFVVPYLSFYTPGGPTK